MNERSCRGYTLLEVLAVFLVMFVAAAILLPALSRPPRPYRIKCVNNLKNVGLAFRIYATDYNDRYPPEIMLSNGVPITKIDPLRVYLTLSNELSTPKIIYCPEDKKRRPAESFTNLTTKNISYFVSLSATETLPQSFLAGDRNLQTNGVTVRTGLLPLSNGSTVGWSKELHKEQGCIAMGDGSVQQFSSARLTIGLRDQGIATNYLAIP